MGELAAALVSVERGVACCANKIVSLTNRMMEMGFLYSGERPVAKFVQRSFCGGGSHA